MSVIFVSFYTQNSGYEEEVKNLIVSCEKFGLSFDIIPIVSKGTWEKNCAYKPRFLLEMLKKHKKPLVWIDADAVILKNPVLFNTLTCDIGIRLFKNLPLSHCSKILSGTIYINNTQNSSLFLELWDEEIQTLFKNKKEGKWDQIALKNAILKKIGKLDFFSLPSSYAAIYDKPCHKNAVILHYQASRLYKKTINKELIPFWETNLFSQETRQKFIEKWDH